MRQDCKLTFKREAREMYNKMTRCVKRKMELGERFGMRGKAQNNKREIRIRNARMKIKRN